MTTPSPIKEALRAELLATIGGELSSGTLKTLIRKARAAQQFLMADGLLEQAGDILNDEDGEPNGTLGSPYPGGSMLYANGGVGMNNETFGAKMLRELLSTLPDLLRKQQETPEKIVAAIAAAKDAGLDDVVAQLKVKLLGSKPPPAELAAHEMAEAVIAQVVTKPARIVGFPDARVVTPEAVVSDAEQAQREDDVKNGAFGQDSAELG